MFPPHVYQKIYILMGVFPPHVFQKIYILKGVFPHKKIYSNFASSGKNRFIISWSIVNRLINWLFIDKSIYLLMIDRMLNCLSKMFACWSLLLLIFHKTLIISLLPIDLFGLKCYLSRLPSRPRLEQDGGWGGRDQTYPAGGECSWAQYNGFYQEICPALLPSSGLLQGKQFWATGII